jgi:hypothetical protein
MVSVPLSWSARYEELKIENERLRTVVEGSAHAIEAVLSDERVDLRPPNSIILRTVVRHLREATDGRTGEASDQTERGQLAGAEVGSTPERGDSTDG